MNMEIPVYNCKIDEDINDETGIIAISFVDCPANEVDFVALRKETEIHLNKDIQKQILTGVVLKPDQLIYRNSPQQGEFYIKFSSQDIEKIAQKMMRTGLALHNTTHQHQKPLNGNYLTELWIVENPENDKSNALGFKNLPKGTLMCSYKVEDKDYWNNEVMTGHVKGFSLEGFFSQELNLSTIKTKKSMSKSDKKKTRQGTLLRKIAGFLLDIEAVEANDTTGSGETVRKFPLEDGNIAIVAEDGYITVGEEKLAAGKHKLADGNLIVVDGEGMFLGTESSAEQTKKTEDTNAPETLRKSIRRRFSEQVEKEPKESKESKEPNEKGGLKEKLAEMQTMIDELSAQLDEMAKSLDEKEEEITSLRKIKPSASPAIQKTYNKNPEDMTAAERMSFALSQTLQNRRK